MNPINPIYAHWVRLAPREKTWVAMATGLVGLAVLWWVLLSPALNTWRHSHTLRAQLDAELQNMHSLQAQARALQAQPQIGREDALRALQATVTQVLGTGSQLIVSGERVTVTLKGISSQSLAQWLTQSRINAHALPTEAHLSRDIADPVAWSGQVVMALPAAR
jgi:general secretion pathway protein M